MRNVHVGALVVAVACWRGGEAPAIVTPAHPAGLFTITEAGFGPIDAHTPATLLALRERLAGFDVRPNTEDTLLYDVYAGSERLFYVIPNDDGSVFDVFATSAKIAVDGHDWRVGQVLAVAPPHLQCECWGDNDYVACHRVREHVGFVMHRDCTDMAGIDAHAHRALVGEPIERLMWTPTSFGEDNRDGDDGASPPKSNGDPWDR